VLVKKDWDAAAARPEVLWGRAAAAASGGPEEAEAKVIRLADFRRLLDARGGGEILMSLWAWATEIAIPFHWFVRGSYPDVDWTGGGGGGGEGEDELRPPRAVEYIGRHAEALARALELIHTASPPPAATAGHGGGGGVVAAAVELLISPAELRRVLARPHGVGGGRTLSLSRAEWAELRCLADPAGNGQVAVRPFLRRCRLRVACADRRGQQGCGVRCVLLGGRFDWDLPM
jgi:hypothetical protein